MTDSALNVRRVRAGWLLALLATLTLSACDFVGGDGDDDGSEVAQENSIVTVAYTGMLEDSTVFNRSPRARFSLQRVIPGFREGVVGMEVGETKTFTVPPEKGYGADPPDESDIPPNATLIFEVTLLAVE